MEKWPSPDTNTPDKVRYNTCPQCKGAKLVNGNRCNLCNGAGQVPAK